jgi:hypothetical protein
MINSKNLQNTNTYKIKKKSQKIKKDEAKKKTKQNHNR